MKRRVGRLCSSPGVSSKSINLVLRGKFAKVIKISSSNATGPPSTTVVATVSFGSWNPRAGRRKTGRFRGALEVGLDKFPAVLEDKSRLQGYAVPLWLYQGFAQDHLEELLVNLEPLWTIFTDTTKEAEGNLVSVVLLILSWTTPSIRTNVNSEDTPPDLRPPNVCMRWVASPLRWWLLVFRLCFLHGLQQGRHLLHHGPHKELRRVRLSSILLLRWGTGFRHVTFRFLHGVFLFSFKGTYSCPCLPPSPVWCRPC